MQPRLQCAYQRGRVQAVDGNERLYVLAQRRLAAGQLPALKRLHDCLMIAAPVEVAQEVRLAAAQRPV